jgi:hypothetical protein
MKYVYAIGVNITSPYTQFVSKLEHHTISKVVAHKISFTSNY